MRWRVRGLLALVVLPVAGCVAGPAVEPVRYLPPLGSNTVFETEPGAAPGHRLVVADLRLEPDAVGAAHYHPWEEFLYVIEGSALLTIAGAEERVLRAGERAVIPARVVHVPRAGPDGVRAIITRVHDVADPITVPVEE
jgi:quercetin dioxygenase-like cupin family protein